MTHLREMEKKDIDDVFHMFVDLYSYLNAKGFILVLNKANLKENLESQLGSKFLKIFIIEVDSEIAGFINISIGKVNSKFVYTNGKIMGNITELYLKKDFRGKQLGKLLIEKAQEYFEKMNVHLIQVNTMGTNENAVKFYKNVGFMADYVSFLKEI